MDVEELVHVHGGEAGLRRERRGDRFAYRDAEKFADMLTSASSASAGNRYAVAGSNPPRP
jgi:hypothetical protein